MENEEFFALMDGFKVPSCPLGCARSVLRVNGKVRISCSIDHIGHKETMDYDEFRQLVSRAKEAARKGT